MAKSVFVISDIHLGANNSLLTAITEGFTATHPRPLAEACVNSLIEDIKARMYGERIEQCVLLGDIFDFSFAPYGLALQNARWFLQKLVDANLFERFIYVPGNHDHHLWQQICEEYYLLSELDNPPVDYPRTLPPNVLLENTLMDKLLPEGYGFEVTYPNYMVQVHQQTYFMHHGHFLQSLYIAASKLLQETIQSNHIEDLERLNAPFLELGWFYMGQAYNIGNPKLLDKLYLMIKNNDTHGVDRVLRLLFKKLEYWDNISPKPFWPFFSAVRNTLLNTLGLFIIKQVFLKHTGFYRKARHASTARHRKVDTRLQETVMQYMQQYLLPEFPHVQECHFVFGHTHEPESLAMCEDSTRRCYHFYNTGGWVVDQIDEHGAWRLPQAAPILIAADGQAYAIPYSETHGADILVLMQADPILQSHRLMKPSG